MSCAAADDDVIRLLLLNSVGGNHTYHGKDSKGLPAAGIDSRAVRQVIPGGLLRTPRVHDPPGRGVEATIPVRHGPPHR